MKIVLNGEPADVPEGSTVRAILEARRIPEEHTAVEINREILDRTRFGQRICEGDEIVVVRFVGGG